MLYVHEWNVMHETAELSENLAILDCCVSFGIGSVTVQNGLCRWACSRRIAFGASWFGHTTYGNINDSKIIIVPFFIIAAKLVKATAVIGSLSISHSTCSIFAGRSRTVDAATLWVPLVNSLSMVQNPIMVGLLSADAWLSVVDCSGWSCCLATAEYPYWWPPPTTSRLIPSWFAPLGSSAADAG